MKKAYSQVDKSTVGLPIGELSTDLGSIFRMSSILRPWARFLSSRRGLLFEKSDLETYGCTLNHADSDIVRALLLDEHYTISESKEESIQQERILKIWIYNALTALQRGFVSLFIVLWLNCRTAYVQVTDK